jgi:hypothetical protein
MKTKELKNWDKILASLKESDKKIRHMKAVAKIRDAYWLKYYNFLSDEALYSVINSVAESLLEFDEVLQFKVKGKVYELKPLKDGVEIQKELTPIEIRFKSIKKHKAKGGNK